jgi:heterodisulfide reductase subunit A-like polyferredoxin
MEKKVVILGGGVAGLEAASNLAAFGFKVDLIEKKHSWGAMSLNGTAFSFEEAG